MHFVFWAVYNCNVGVKRFGENNCKQSYIIYTIFSFGHQLTWLCQNDHICRLIDNQNNMSQMNRDGKVRYQTLGIVSYIIYHFYFMF